MQKTEPIRLLQFRLKAIFGLTTVIGLFLWLVLLVRGAKVPFLTYYLGVGFAQLLFSAPIVYHRLRTIGPSRGRPNEQPYELALLGVALTLDTWVMMVAWMACFRAGVHGFWPPGLVLSLAMVGVLLHLPTFCLQVAGLLVMPDWGRDPPLTALFFLNISNSLLLLGVMTFGARQLLSYGLAAPG